MPDYKSEDMGGGLGRTRHGSPTFYDLLGEMANLHDKKSHDYASNENPYGNYHFAGSLALLFSHSSNDAGFVGRLGEKLYRLANIEKDSKIPQNESIEDTERDLCVIMCLWISDRRDRRRRGNPLTDQLLDLIKLMPDKQTEEIVQFIYDMRRIRGGMQGGNLYTSPNVEFTERRTTARENRTERSYPMLPGEPG
jgi:hypothetical protein